MWKALYPGGKEDPVTEDNKVSWVNMIAKAHMREEIRPQIKSFLEGLYELIPEDSLKIFNSSDLELLISGLPTIDSNVLLMKSMTSRTILPTEATLLPTTLSNGSGKLWKLTNRNSWQSWCNSQLGQVASRLRDSQERIRLQS